MTAPRRDARGMVTDRMRNERKEQFPACGSVLKEIEADAATDWLLLGDTNGCDIDKDCNPIACF